MELAKGGEFEHFYSRVMDEEVVDLLHQAIKVSFRLLAIPRKQVVDDLLETMFQLCPK